MSTQTGHKRTPYMRIFAVLAVLTVIEVAITFTPISKSAQVLLLIALAIAKATLVAMYYMHLRFEGPLIRIIATVPLLLAIILTLLPLFDLVLLP